MKMNSIFSTALSAALLTPVIVIPMPAAAAGNESSKFTDTQSLPVQDQQKISVLVNRGIISGYADGTFRAQQPVTRGLFASFIARTFELQKPY
ncbi:hypothetical protein NCCP2716_30970 [Sporosarcina sp. NCCP-2716]|uniref:S-layer homology domain-containing protein n=1 Tax=Sporosarcina sp. NCCP-2716 TaxID=2943679 RepID=UPI00204067A6|nr:S-layer homology domain-containing protein [Sporosarcina sp. NCCP-2716]GKV70599.1 hypothetical protein NCCP2716_30970 [Sporosarcina sp. NCCP-2716]